MLTGLVLMVGAQQVPTKTGGRAFAGGTKSRPNVLLIVTDDQRIGTLDVMPTLRRKMMRVGVNFKNAFATTPWCCPSRASIFTGQYSHNHGVHRADWRRMPHRESFQRYLDRSGYRTAIYGKFLNGWPGELPPPYWDNYSIFVDDGYRYYDAVFSDNGTRETVDTNSTTYVADKGTTFIDQAEADDGRPWLLYLAPFAPHCPCVSEEKYAESELPAMEETPATLEWNREDKPLFVQQARASEGRIARVREGQLRTLPTVDDLVAQVFSKLAETDEANNTLVFFVSDNGYLWGEHRLVQKSLPYTESIKVPMIMRWPAGGIRRDVDRRIVANIDIAPTVLRAAGLRVPDSVDGRSLFRGDKRTRILTEAWGSHSYPWAKWASIRTRGYQYVEYYEEGRGTDVLAREYYDLKNDPWQLHNLLGDDKKGNDPRLKAIKAQLTRDRTCKGNACP
ncbi:MAG: sulfatase [Actinomycetota bacterium]|nr:sulfatase [Actinomycetota bacterium]